MQWLTSTSASSIAEQVDVLFWFLIAVTGFMAVALAVLVVGFAIRYRRRSPNEFPVQIRSNLKMEIGWTVATFLVFMVMFFWGARLYFAIFSPPPDAIEMFAVGKQWMWKLQHPGGQREINALHVPVGTPVRVTLTSEDVIHSFYVPAFRVKQDAVPGRYTTLWFKADKPGKYHLYCSEYCGTKHSGMIGYVYALSRGDYSEWLSAGGAEGSLASRGAKLFQQFGCASCHYFDGRGPCPSLQGVYGSVVQLTDGSTTVADPRYLRESMLDPEAKVVYGFRPIMPTFQGQLSEEQIIAIIQFLKTIGQGTSTMPNTSGAAPKETGAQKGVTPPQGTGIFQSEVEER